MCCTVLRPLLLAGALWGETQVHQSFYQHLYFTVPPIRPAVIFVTMVKSTNPHLRNKARAAQAHKKAKCNWLEFNWMDRGRTSILELQIMWDIDVCPLYIELAWLDTIEDSIGTFGRTRRPRHSQDIIIKIITIIIKTHLLSLWNCYYFH